MTIAAQPMRVAKEDEILALMAAGFSPTEAAAKADRSASTVYRLLARPDFAARLHEARAMQLRPHVEKLVTALGRAIDKMLAVMDDPTVVASTQLRAAAAVAELALKFHERVDVLPRLVALEACVGGGFDLSTEPDAA